MTNMKWARRLVRGATITNNADLVALDVEEGRCHPARAHSAVAALDEAQRLHAVASRTGRKDDWDKWRQAVVELVR